jgi:predicted ribonuclease toxin of YeeF-YezG toxin-antitoxin module
LSAYPWPSNGAQDAYSAVQGPVGMEVPDWVSGSDAITQNLVDAVTMIAKKLENADVAWTAIVGASQALKDASATYFASAAGQTNTALTRIFRPGRVYEYGCFNSYWSE